MSCKFVHKNGDRGPRGRDTTRLSGIQRSREYATQRASEVATLCAAADRRRHGRATERVCARRAPDSARELAPRLPRQQLRRRHLR
eukprot:3602929-Rhodomonas_salina.1